MRQIKFRAWDTVTEKMYFGDSVMAYGDDSFAVLADADQPSTGCAYLMQYTGLKDKNGKEIYEGDVIQYETYTDEYGTTDFIKEVVEFEAGAYQTLSSMPSEEFEVIGNLYEHPELLK